jgi:hypothetical protein
MAYDENNVWTDESTVRHLIRKVDGSTELREDCDNLAEGEVCEREFQAIKKEHCTILHDGDCQYTIEVDATWDAENRPEPADEVKMAAIRQERNRLLAECDWTQLTDSPLGQDDRIDWQLYRQALRDLPETVDADAPVYPTKPE